MIERAKKLTSLYFLIICFLPLAIFAQNRAVTTIPDVRTAVFSPHGRFAVQLFIVDDQALAQRITTRFQQGGSPAYYVLLQDPSPPTMIGTYFAIRIGGFDLRSKAENFARTYLSPLGYEYTVELRENEWTMSDDYDTGPQTPYIPRGRLPSAPSFTPTKFVFSVRPEFVAGTSVMGAGLTFELGGLHNSGYYITTQFGGGGMYYGGMLNFGRWIRGYDNLRHIAGLSGGYMNIMYLVHFTEDKKKINEIPQSKTIGNNLAFGGVFWKLLSGSERNFDITNRVLFGFKENPIWYDRETSNVEWRREFNVIYSASIGYTLTKRRYLTTSGRGAL